MFCNVAASILNILEVAVPLLLLNQLNLWSWLSWWQDPGRRLWTDEIQLAHRHGNCRGGVGWRNLGTASISHRDGHGGRTRRSLWRRWCWWTHSPVESLTWVFISWSNLRQDYGRFLSYFRIWQSQPVTSLTFFSGNFLDREQHTRSSTSTDWFFGKVFQILIYDLL